MFPNTTATATVQLTRRNGTQRAEILTHPLVDTASIMPKWLWPYVEPAAA